MARPGRRGNGFSSLNGRVVLALADVIEALASGPDTSGATCASVGGDLWFPADGAHGQEEKKAIALCAQCPVRRACLDKALSGADNVRHGIWAGYSPTTLTRMRRLRLALQACVPPKQGVAFPSRSRAEGEHHAA